MWPIALKAGALPNGRYQEDKQTFMLRCDRQKSALNGHLVIANIGEAA